MSFTEPEYLVNPGFSAQTIFVGVDREPVLIIDDFLAKPEAILRLAETGVPFHKDDKDFYPGIRKPLSMAYASNTYRHLQELFVATFSPHRRVEVEPLACLLSLATTRPEHLRPIQSVPHFDNLDSAHLAGVHYLCSEEFGGTSFYRHRSTAYESMSEERIAQYAPRLKQEVINLKTRTFTYTRGDTVLFERTASVEARFNRAIYYRSHILHSGDIGAITATSADPRMGRLTVNTLGVLRARD
jgi:hypothetical protein